MKSKIKLTVPGLTEETDPTAVCLDKIFLRKGEVIQVHMDCMNQHGQLITVKDIKDLGGVVSKYWCILV